MFKFLKELFTKGDVFCEECKHCNQWCLNHESELSRYIGCMAYKVTIKTFMHSFEMHPFCEIVNKDNRCKKFEPKE